MLRTLVARLSRDLGARLLRLSERLATAPDEASERRRAEALLRERCPDAPEHWIQLVAARSHGFTAHHAGQVPAHRARQDPAPVPRPTREPRPTPPPSSVVEIATERNGSRATAGPCQPPAKLPTSPPGRRPMIDLASGTSVRPSAPPWPAAGTPRREPAAAFHPGEGRRRPVLVVVEPQPRERPPPAAPRWSEPGVSARTDAAPASFAVAAGSDGGRPAFVDAMARSEQPALAADLAWPRPEHRPAAPPGPTWPAPMRPPAALVLPTVAPPRRSRAEAVFPEPQPDAAGPWPELPLPADRQDAPRTEPHATTYRERLARLARDQELL